MKIRQTLGSGFFVTAYTFDKYVNFMQGKANRPKFKKKRQQKVKAYFPKNTKGETAR